MIAAKSWGNPENPPILAVHGWLDNANSFEPLATFLQQNYYLIAIDLPGHGYSSHLPVGGNYHFIDGLFVIIQILNALNLDKVHLLGHSLGACLVSIVASLVPERVRSLSLIEGLGPLTLPPETAHRQLRHYLDYLINTKTKKPKHYPNIDFAAKARSIKGYVSLEIAKILCERGLVKRRGELFWRHDSRLLTPSPLQMTEDQVLSCLTHIKAKTYLFWASNGFSYHYELMKKRIEAVDDLMIKRLEGGHHIHMEQPKEVAQLLAVLYQST